ncbi:thioredoxin [Streptomyces anulatus]|uniref:thioredoxin n=1 Tax=Streptomyces TaxID=1883 RepID=UPI003829A359
MSEPFAVTDDSFAGAVLEVPGPVLVSFWAEWAGTCKMVRPLLREAAQEFAGRVSIAELNIDQSPETAPEYEVDGLPTLLIFRDGTVVARKVGAMSKGQLTEFLEQHV